ncbi:MAG: amino acid permease, partial [Leptospiraceae bacterium]|nr:amino acid permease [Leptospiraceae bacterium]
SILFGKADIVPAAPLLNPPPEGALSFSILFSIFFPAVTGFEAGVSMSGDLEDPKKSIPFGTIFAIIVGLVVYIGLAVFFAYKVDPNELANNPGVLQKLTYYLPVLLAGIWGATISSAIGSILGAPRILQATSIDRITPKFFARGYGKTNEPRNALILTIIIAELGILIGELDAIARVVSMFFIAAYSFLNISCAIESLVSPDFRPEFKIPKWVGILGSITCFVIMIQLDLVAMIGAVVIMSLLFLYIKSKELSLEGGDTVGSIWSSVVRQGLFQLTKNKLHERNWRPNMLLFSGGSDSRPYLVEMAKSLAENRGIITNFHLFETEEFNNLSRSQIVAEEVQEFGGVFSRKIECTDIYDEMVQICKYHGFSGMDPNTILLGRARSLTNIKKFSNLIQNLESMDFNVLMFDYDKVNGFGDRSKVDVWWSGHGNNLSFSILLVRFLQSSPKWQNSKFRFCLILNDRTLLETTERKIESILDKYRVRADVFIHYNGLEKKPFYEIIQNKSKDASLTILGLPNYNTEDPIKIGKRIAHFADELKSILWIKANSYFHNVSILPDYSIKKEITEDYNVNLELNKELNPPKELLLFFEDLKKIIEEYYYSYISPIFDNQFNLLEKYKILVNDTYNSLKEKNSYKDIALISQKQAEFFEEAENLIKNYKNEQVNADIETFKKGINVLIENLNNLIIKQPRKIQIFYERELFNNEKRDTFKIRTYKNFKRIFSFNKKIGSKIKFKKMTGLFLRNSLPQEVIEIINLI